MIDEHIILIESNFNPLMQLVVLTQKHIFQKKKY